MFTEKHYLEHIDDDQLDAYLKRGWYRMGQSVFTCRFLIFRETLYSSIWVRLPLAGYTFSKSKRKKLRKLNRRFQTIIRPFEHSAEKEQLYLKYRRNFPARIAPTLSTSLLDGTDHNIFNSHEVCVYDGEQLVAYSIFDLGEQSLASILGVYHPDYAEYSLGYFTMLLEIQFGLEEGFDYFYPGYVVPGYPKFNYKLQIGKVEYYRESSMSWQPYSELDEGQLPEKVMWEKLNEARDYLAQQGLNPHIYLYPPYEANLLGYWILDYLDYPLILEIKPAHKPGEHFILMYDFRQESYLLYQCTVYDNLNEFFRPMMSSTKPETPMKLELLIKDQLLCRTEDLSEIPALLARIRGTGSA